MDFSIKHLIIFIITIMIFGPLVLYFTVPSSRPVFAQIGCAFNPVSCTIQKTIDNKK